MATLLSEQVAVTNSNNLVISSERTANFVMLRKGKEIQILDIRTLKVVNTIKDEL